MKKWKFSKRIAAVLLAMSMMLNLMPSTAMAATGDIANVETGLTGDINTNDTISLPVQILDYESDGMLFEFAEAAAGKSGVAAAKTAGDFGATWYEDYTTRTSVGGSINTGNYWSDVSLALKTGTYANYTRMTWAGNTSGNWTGNRAGVVMADFTTSSTYTTDQIRYMVVVFRSNVRSGNFTVGLNRANLNGAGTDGNYTGNIAITTENNTNWTYAVLDLKKGTLGSNWSKGAVHGVYVGLPIDASGEWMDLAHVAFFSNKDQATAFGEYALTDGSDRGDNRAFGLLRGSRNQEGTVDFTGIDDVIGDSVQMLNTYGTSATVKDLSTITGLGYKLLGTFGLKGIANIGLLESKLSSEGYPVYKKEVVDYVASLLKDALEVPERTSDGWKNYRYIKGTASNIYGGTDLATALRTKINGKMGTYAEASGKDLIGTWAEVAGNITSYYDAAYFMLNSIFVPGSYNALQENYDYLVLSAGTDSETNEKVYVFDGGFANTASPSGTADEIAIEYNKTEHTIQNTSAAGKAHFYYEGTNTTTLHPFLPITDRNTEAGMTKSPYYQDDGVIQGVKKQTTKDTQYKRNFSFTVVSEGEFVYHADDELFFEFEGDDDVYLFINNELVLDIGSAHSIDIVRFNLNDYVNAAKAGTLGDADRNEALSLTEGNTYTFKFYYMERHSYGSNIRISTNIRVTDPSMLTGKTAWQDGDLSDSKYEGVQLDFGSIVDPKEVVEYGFSITNNGEENLYNLSFTDTNIGVKLNPTDGLEVTGSRVYDVNGGTLEVTDLTAVITHPDYDPINVTFTNDAALKLFLKELTAVGTVAGDGLFVGATVEIRGIGYKLDNTQINAGVFDNTVLTTSTNATGSKILQGQASMRVFVPADPMYYEWADHELKVSKTKLIEDILVAANQEGNILAGKVPNLSTNNVNKIELVTKAGTAITSDYVKIDGSNNLTINYPTAGSKVFYVKITYNTSKTVIIPVLVNVTNVQDVFYVLDYGLSVDFVKSDILTKQDAVTVPGRTTKTSVITIGTGGNYKSNEITINKVDADGYNAADGKFTINGETVTYVPSDFMEEINSVQVAVNVYESDITPSKLDGTLDINNEVEMFKSINVLPANVVYYEDCFPAIKYEDSANKTQTNSFTALGSQSNNQDQEYGKDDYYQDDTTMSAGSLTTIMIDSNSKVATFTFTGTGFELIGRTNASDSATLIVRVKDVLGKTVKTIPVITEFDNGDNGGNEEIYQIPVVRVNELLLESAPYTVEISGVPARDYNEKDNEGNPVIIPTYLYVDGLRIFQPLGDTNENYNDAENGAAFVEIRDLIANQMAAMSTYNNDNVVISSGGTTWTEDLKDGDTYVGQATTVEEYLLYGPNNELYMNGDLSQSVVAFYVKETDAKSHALQIAVRAIDPVNFFLGSDYEKVIGDQLQKASVRYGVVNGDANGWTETWTVESGTEQYYTINYKNCPYDADRGAYLVAFEVTEGMASLSSLKLTGLEVQPVEAPAMMSMFRIMSRQMRSTEVYTEEDLNVDMIPGGDIDIPEEDIPEQDASGMPDQNDFVDRAEFIKKLIEFLKQFWGR